MVINHIDFQSSDNYYLKIYNLENRSSFTVFKGKFYACFSEIHNLGRIVSFKNRRTAFPLCIFNKKVTSPIIIGEIKIEKKTDIYFKNFKIYADDIIHIRIKAAILIDILFKKSNLILFHTAGLTYPSSMIIYQRIYRRLQEYPEKSAIVFEYREELKRIAFEEVSVDNINNYEEWIIR
ncbi:hypothetical protein [Bacteroides sp.]|uniref:hypothetical protein n=1 Tax=Bacteroides sp. TaxID=29523 RepID=UPI0025C4570F|nr:hypothetical protein [Bacteroides sp.]